MKRFLLLALTSGLFSPIAAKAESYWLILNAQGANGGMALEKIQMRDMAHCEKQGDKFNADLNSNSYSCLTGK